MTNNIPFVSFENKKIQEFYKKYSHPSGLDIYIFPKKMTATYAIFGTKYGSIHNRFKAEDDSNFITVPDGIAHFLEHKLFVCEDGSDAFERFSDYGADANAYTSFNKTCYLFSCTDRFSDSLGELLEFVTHPYFTQESVQNEIGIISEEIKMYDDNPSDRCFYGMLEGMYKSHSIKRNICGTEETISQITPELLYACYERFYRLSNMALVVCGDVDDNEVLEIADKHLPKTAQNAPNVICANENENESPSVYMSYVEKKMQVAKPMFKIGIKDTAIPELAADRQRKEAKMAILNEMIFSGSMDLYASLIEKDMISPAFSYGYTIGDSFAYNSVSGESDDPQAVLSEILAHIEKLRQTGLDYGDFLRSKRVMYAEAVKSYDSVENIANNLFSFVCDGFELLSDTDIIDSITFEEICELFEVSFNKESITMSAVLPI
ncbi:MAG: insulinase family protein [Clostridia bacterium]|nr:insulinase family protein [Clostridia bacterium]